MPPNTTRGITRDAKAYCRIWLALFHEIQLTLAYRQPMTEDQDQTALALQFMMMGLRAENDDRYLPDGPQAA
jgi:hypothetical protein